MRRADLFESERLSAEGTEAGKHGVWTDEYVAEFRVRSLVVTRMPQIRS